MPRRKRDQQQAVEKALAALRAGATLRRAARRAGFHRATLHRWRAAELHFDQAVRDAAGLGRRAAVAGRKAAAAAGGREREGPDGNHTLKDCFPASGPAGSRRFRGVFIHAMGLHARRAVYTRLPGFYARLGGWVDLPVARGRRGRRAAWGWLRAGERWLGGTAHPPVLPPRPGGTLARKYGGIIGVTAVHL